MNLRDLKPGMIINSGGELITFVKKSVWYYFKLKPDSKYLLDSSGLAPIGDSLIGTFVGWDNVFLIEEQFNNWLSAESGDSST